MAAITATSIIPAGAVVVSRLTLGASDTMTYNPARKPILLLDNVTAGSLTPTIDGDGGSTVNVDGIGSISVASGYTTPAIAAGAMVAIKLPTIKEYLKGAITITGGTGIRASILEQ